MNVFTGNLMDKPHRSTNTDFLKKEIKQLESANRMLADFAHILAHDMRSSMRAIANFAELLLVFPSVSDNPQSCGLLQKIVTLVRGIQTVTDKSRTGRQRFTKSADSQASSQQLLIDAQSMNQELTEAACSVAQDLRNPLSQIVRLADFLTNLSTIRSNPVASDLASQLLVAAKKLKALVDDYVTFFQTERHELKRERVSLRSIVELARHELEPQAAGRTIVWQISSLSEVEGDPAMLRQVVLNLLSNAIKFTRLQPEARIEIGIQQNSDNCVLYIRDNGLGFDSASAPNLFLKFQRLHTKLDFEGTGVGLVLVYHIIQRHGGNVWAESVPGQGATFYVQLPKQIS